MENSEKASVYQMLKIPPFWKLFCAFYKMAFYSNMTTQNVYFLQKRKSRMCGIYRDIYWVLTPFLGCLVIV